MIRYPDGKKTVRDSGWDTWASSTLLGGPRVSKAHDSATVSKGVPRYCGQETKT